jgi:MFS family permease
MKDVSAARWAFGGMVALAVAMGIGRFVYTPILPAMAQALRLDHATTGWIASANFLGYLLGAFWASTLMPRANAALFGGLLLSAMTTAAMGMVSSSTIFIALRFAGGVASALVLVCGSAIVLDKLQEKGRDGLSALHFAGVGLGIAVSALLVTVLSDRGADWRALWIASGALSLLAAIALPFLLAGGQAHTTPAPNAKPPASANKRIVTALLWAYGLFGFGYVITATFLVVQVRQTAPSAEPWVWLIVGVTAVPSVAAWTWIGARIGLLRSYALASALEAVGVAASVLMPTRAGALIAAALLGGTFVGLTALGLRAAREHAPDPERMIAWMTAAFGLGQIIGPIFAGQLAAHTGNFTISTLVAAATLLVAAVLTGFARVNRSGSGGA